MNYKIIARIVSQILGLEALFMLPSIFFALAEGRSRTALSFSSPAGEGRSGSILPARGWSASPFPGS